MRDPKLNKPYWLILGSTCIILVLLFSVTAFSRSVGIMERIKAVKEKQDPNAQVSTFIPVPINSVQAKVQYQRGDFFTETRKNEISRFRCTSCHNNEQVKIRNAAAVAHADIKVDHGEKGTPLSCNTCHNPENRDYLQTHKEDKIDMDHVYNMCGECHFRQKKDWIGGAHGKRVSHWAGERVVKNCTSCHDPHSPLFKKRWPKTYSVPLK